MRFLYIAQQIFSLTNNNMGKNHHNEKKKKAVRLSNLIPQTVEK